MTELRDAHVLVTGGSEGIGLAVAERAARAGARVSLIARDPGKLTSAAVALGAASDWRSADVTDDVALGAAIGELEAAHGGVDVLVCCAGVSLPGRFLDVPLAELDEQWDVNVRGSVAATRAVLPGMIARGRGHLVLTSSTAGTLGVVGLAAYCATKFAVRGFAEALRYETEPAGVHVTVLYPPDTETPGFAKENLRKPPETAAVSGTIKPVPAAKVADALARGLARNRPAVTMDAWTATFLRAGGLLDPMVKATMRRTIARSRAD